MAGGRLFIDGLRGNGAPFERVPFGERSLDEAWLRDVLYEQPDLIPLDEAFPGAGGVSTICTEMPLSDLQSALSLDVFGITPNGRPVLVECKLWRNPEARRKVVTQILEYSAILRGFSYGHLEATLKRKLQWTGENPLFHHVRRRFPDINEIAFVEGVTRSLSTGDFHLLIAGDGIRTDAQTLVRLLEDTGLVARLSMMEVNIWRSADSAAVFVAPTVPTRVDVDRYRVYVDAGGQPVSLEQTSESSEISDTGQDGTNNRRRSPEEVSAERLFWEELLRELEFDNPEQEHPKYRYPNHAKAPLPAPAERMVLFRTKHGQVGVFIVIDDTEEGKVLIDNIHGEIDAIQEEVDLPVEYRHNPKRDKPYFIVSQFLDTRVDDHERQQKDWLKGTSNRMVNAFRPRIERVRKS